MSEVTMVILPYREQVGAALRLLKADASAISAQKELDLSLLAKNCVRNLYHYRTLARQKWRIRCDSDSTALEMALKVSKIEYCTQSITNLSIILSPLIEAIEDVLDNVIPYRSMNVYNVEINDGDLILYGHGDYRILKFKAEHPNWKPGLEEPEELILAAR